MSVESAVAYIHRMREDEAFHKLMNDNSEDDAACWEIIRAHGFEFSVAEFKLAQDEIYKEFGLTPM